MYYKAEMRIIQSIVPSSLFVKQDKYFGFYNDAAGLVGSSRLEGLGQTPMTIPCRQRLCVCVLPVP